MRKISKPSSKVLLQAPPWTRGLAEFSRRRDPSVTMSARIQVGLAHGDAERGSELLRSLSHHRVGGAFWVLPTKSPRKPLVVRAHSDVQALNALDAAVQEWEASQIFLSAEASARTRRLEARLRELAIPAAFEPHDPWSVLADAAMVWTTSGEDLFALLAAAAGVPIRCLEPSLIGGDELSPLEDQRPIARIAHALLVDDVRYQDPFSGEEFEAEDAIALLGLWSEQLRADHDLRAATGIAPWKRRALKRFFPGSKLKFGNAKWALQSAAESDGTALAWPSRAPANIRAQAAALGAPLAIIEDGFLRSVGLGAECRAPLSITVDRSGYHVDPQRPSDLERLLETTAFSPELLSRARRLVDRIRDAGLTKYNVGERQTLARPHERRVVLVIGQVEDDLSVHLGGGGVRGNLELLRRARAHEGPSAYLIYKPHPDVEAGLRIGALRDDEALAFADAIERERGLPALLPAVDAVHVLTSLAGFEALLRNVPVVTHGQPFFAGWGLTEDLNPPPRRGRRLSLDELAAAALILYPRYLDPVTRLPCPPEVLIDRLATTAASRPETTVLPALRRVQGRAQAWLRKTKPSLGFRAKKAPPHRQREGRTFLFLQNQPGDFFRRLADALDARGHSILRVNFNGGDVFDWRGRPAIDYRGRLSGWPAFLLELLSARHVTDIVLFGDCRPAHRSARAVAAGLGVAVHVFDEGYLRPDWVTLERGGVNGFSPLPLDPDFYRREARALPPRESRELMPSTLKMRMRAAVLYYLSAFALAPLFPFYRTHRPWPAIVEAIGWIAKFARRSGQEKALRAALMRLRRTPYFLAPLQLDSDYQLRAHSDFAGMQPALAQMIASFAQWAPNDVALAIKSHPLDNGLVDWRKRVQALARASAVEHRVIFLDGGDITHLVQGSLGVVTVNSTTGALALQSGIPVITLGRAIYDLPGLTHRSGLASFWRTPEPPDGELYEAFERVLVDRCLLRGGFFGELQGCSLADAAAERILAASKSSDAQSSSRAATRGAA